MSAAADITTITPGSIFREIAFLYRAEIIPIDPINGLIAAGFLLCEFLVSFYRESLISKICQGKP